MGWDVIKATATGASHTRAGLPNQDAIQSWEDRGRGVLALAVADGHGSRKCFRSDIGAQLAVREALESIQEFSSYFSEEGLSKSTTKDFILKSIFSNWKERLDSNLLEVLSSDLINVINPTSQFAEIIEEYWGRDCQHEVFTNEELSQLRELTVRVMEDFLLNQDLSTESLLNWRLTDDLRTVLTPAWRDIRWLKNLAHRASQELWKRFLTRHYQVIVDSYLEEQSITASDWQNLTRLTESTSKQVNRLASDIGKVLIRGMSRTWSEAFPVASTIELIGGTWLPRRIVERWMDAVTEDLQKNAFTDGEADGVRGNPLLAYGTTLLAVLVTNDFILFLQMGDGDILTVSETGNVSRPIARDSNLIANETYSLCLPNAWKLFRLELQPISEQPPAVIMLSTDGYSNSYKTERDFFRVGEDILNIARTAGKAAINQDLGTWLKETSEEGSGDDITLGLIFREDVFRLPDGDDEHSLDQAAETVGRDPGETGNANILS